MTNWLRWGAIAAVLSAVAWLYQHGREVERSKWRAETEQARAEAVQSARTTEQQRYGDLLNALNDQYLAQRAITDRLHGDLERLRDRPPRVIRVPGDPATECQGATGAELSGPDAEFLTRLAASADRHRAALAACYAYADSLQGGDR